MLMPTNHLRTATAAWVYEVCSEYDLEPHHVRLLLLAAQAWDRAEQAREILAQTGLTFLDRNACPKPRPEIAVERDCRIAFARLMRELDLDMTGIDEARPPILKSNRG